MTPCHYFAHRLCWSKVIEEKSVTTKSMKCSLFSTLREPSVNRKDQLALARPTRYNPVLYYTLTTKLWFFNNIRNKIMQKSKYKKILLDSMIFGLPWLDVSVIPCSFKLKIQWYWKNYLNDYKIDIVSITPPFSIVYFFYVSPPKEGIFFDYLLWSLFQSSFYKYYRD